MADILILEPDRRAARRMCDTLVRSGHTVAASHSVRDAEKQLGGRRMLIVLNAQVPFTQSYAFLRFIEERGLPVLFITGDAANENHLKAMYRGDCGVLLSPFTPVQLNYAVEQLARRSSRTLSLGGLRLDTQTREVTKDGETLTLTAQEFELLQALMRSPDEAVSREELLRTAWGYQGMGITRTVDVHVQRLRRKLGPAAIETVYKTGYRLRLA